MKRRAALLFVGLAALGLLAVVACALLPSGPGVTKANFYRIEDGMSLAQVEALLGPPDYNSPSGRNWELLYNGKTHVGHTRRVWGGDDGGARIDFDEEGRVFSKTWVDNPESFLDRLRRWFAWLPL
jgi:outer membrane protein assembly factor BamE (lipoprotein component of BamABCDE complex)